MARRTRKARRGKQHQDKHRQEPLSLPGKVARRIKAGIRKLVG